MKNILSIFFLLCAAVLYSQPTTISGDQVRGSVPPGGSTDQVLSKISGTDYDYQWSTPTAAPTDFLGTGFTSGGGTGTIPSGTFMQADFLTIGYNPSYPSDPLPTDAAGGIFLSGSVVRLFSTDGTAGTTKFELPATGGLHVITDDSGTTETGDLIYSKTGLAMYQYNATTTDEAVLNVGLSGFRMRFYRPDLGADIEAETHGGMTLKTYDAADGNTTIEMKPTYIQVGSSGVFEGLKYDSDISANQTSPQDIPDIGNVDARIAAAVAGVGSFTPTVTEYATAGTDTYTVPAGATRLKIECTGGGGGGASGQRGALGIIRRGSGGGGGGGYSVYTVVLSEIGSPSTLSLTIGAGGAGGAAITTNSTAGAAGSAGGETSVTYTGGLPLCSAFGGAGGTGGVGNTAGVGGDGGAGMFRDLVSPSGATGTAGNGIAPTDEKNIIPGGGASGGGVFDDDDPKTGGPGGASFFGKVTGPSGGAVNGGAGSAGSMGSATWSPVGPGGGGGGSNSSSGTGGAGGAGGAGIRGGGGGAGGAVENGSSSGAGGAGGDGFIRISAF